MRLNLIWLLGAALLAGKSRAVAQPDTAKIQKQEDFYGIHTVPVPEHVFLEVGGMTLFHNDALAVSTRRGEVWVIGNPYLKNGRTPDYRLYAQGLHEPLGLNYIRGDLYLAQRTELTRLRDLDGDGEADEYHTVYSWPVEGNYHEYAYGPLLDREGNFVVSLNLGYTDRAVSLSRWHGWMLKITPEGEMIPFATGMRSPAGLGMNSAGDLFYAENEGEWVGSGGITHVEKGDFLGHPEGLKWAGLPTSPVRLRPEDIQSTGESKFDVAKRVPGLKNTSVWFPHTMLGISTSDILNYDERGKMGPFQGQLFVGDQGHSKIMRVFLEKVNGAYQGAVFPFVEGFSSGVLRMIWGSDGSMFVGMTSRGWGSTGSEPYGLQRLEWNGRVPFEIKQIEARPDGFELEFTKPVDPRGVFNEDSYQVTRFTYMYSHHYGSPVIDPANCPVRAVELSEDRLRVRLVVDSMRQGYIHEIRAGGIRSAENYALLHPAGYYTLNNIPDGPRLKISSANVLKKASPAEEVVQEHARVVEEKPAPGPTRAVPSTSKRITNQPADWTGGPEQVIDLHPLPGLKFNTDQVTVPAGARVKLTFNNTDDMPHNVVITKPGTADETGVKALQLGLNGQRMNFVPDSENVLFHTAVLRPGTRESIYFEAPAKPGNYQFVCTYPGHYLVMKGTLKVVAR